ITFGSDITAFVGLNNAGKSALMRFLLEFRNLFDLLRNDNTIANFINGAKQNFGVGHVLDPDEVFSNLNDDGIAITINLIAADQTKAWDTLLQRSQSMSLVVLAFGTLSFSTKRQRSS